MVTHNYQMAVDRLGEAGLLDRALTEAEGALKRHVEKEARKRTFWGRHGGWIGTIFFAGAILFLPDFRIYVLITAAAYLVTWFFEWIRETASIR
jgi:hypothetical protein